MTNKPPERGWHFSRAGLLPCIATLFIYTPMTTRTPEDLTKAREALAGHLNSWRQKHSLTVQEAHQILTVHMQQENAKAKRKQKLAQQQQPAPRPPPTVAYARAPVEDERAAQEREGRARAAQQL